MKAKKIDTSPAKSLLEEIDTFQALSRTAIEGYAMRIDGDLSAIQTWAKNLAEREKIPPNKLRAIRDMLTLLRNADVKPEKGRRKDLKKIDSIVSDLTMIIEDW